MMLPYPLFHPGILVFFIVFVIVFAIASMLAGSYFETKGKMKSPGAFWIFGMFSGFVMGALTVIGVVLAHTR